MDKKEYFFNAIRHKRYCHRDWLIAILGITTTDNIPEFINTTPFMLFTKRDGTHVTYKENGELITITGSVPDGPLIIPKETLTISKDSNIPNYVSEEPLETTYGNVLVNLILLVYAFENRVPFVIYPTGIKSSEKKIAALMRDEVEAGETRDPGAIYYDQLLKYSEGADLLRGIGYLINPSGSKGTFTVSPEVISLRNSLYEKHKHELHNPAVISAIAQQLEDADKRSLKGDISEGFFTSGKLWSVARMKTFIMLGIEPSLSSENPSSPVLTSLSEGWKIKDIPDLINGQRYGSYARGKLTEFGGVIVKLTSQAFRDSSITEHNCNTDEGLAIKVNKNYLGLLEGQYVLGTESPITMEELVSNTGKVLTFRSPSRCKTPAPGYCAMCIGAKYSGNPRGLPIAATTVGSIFMGISMARMHGKPLKLKELILENAFS